MQVTTGPAAPPYWPSFGMRHTSASPTWYIKHVHKQHPHCLLYAVLAPAGDHRPCSTTLLAFFWHAGSLWAIPDLPRVDQGGGRASKVAAAGYQLLRLCMDSRQWQVVRCQVRG
jgi:hypothetical protein